MFAEDDENSLKIMRRKHSAIDHFVVVQPVHNNANYQQQINSAGRTQKMIKSVIVVVVFKYIERKGGNVNRSLGHSNENNNSTENSSYYDDDDLKVVE